VQDFFGDGIKFHGKPCQVVAQGSNSFGFLLRPHRYFHTGRDQGTVALAHLGVRHRREAGAWKQQPQLTSTEKSNGLVEFDAARKDLVVRRVAPTQDGSSRRATARQILVSVTLIVDARTDAPTSSSSPPPDLGFVAVVFQLFQEEANLKAKSMNEDDRSKIC
ncbi:unnamed protein product, partial [Musa banksii]